MLIQCCKALHCINAPSPYMAMVFMFFAKMGSPEPLFITFFIYLMHTFLYYRDYMILKYKTLRSARGGTWKMVAQIFTESNNNDTVTVNLGDTFLIKLRDEPAEHLYSKEEEHTAHTVWEMKAGGGLKLLRDQFIPDVPDTKTVPGVHEWEYEAAEIGSWEIEGKYTIYRFGGEEKYRLTVKVI